MEKLSKDFVNFEVSHGTLLTRDLIDSISLFFSIYLKDNNRFKEITKDLILNEMSDASDDEKAFTKDLILNEDIFELLNDVAPEGCYFGAHIGDGSCFGFWEFEKEEDEVENSDNEEIEFKNILVQYQGGGYSGCFWEWNFFVFDDSGKFYNVYSSGRGGINDEYTAKVFLGKIFTEDNSKLGNGVYVYDLTKEDSVFEFQNECNEGLVVSVTHFINKILRGELSVNIPEIWFKCDRCGVRVTDIGYASNYSGTGGIVLQANSKFCESCFNITEDNLSD